MLLLGYDFFSTSVPFLSRFLQVSIYTCPHDEERSTVLGVRFVLVCDLQKVVKLGLVGLFNSVHQFSSSLYTATLKIVFQFFDPLDSKSFILQFLVIVV